MNTGNLIAIIAIVAPMFLTLFYNVFDNKKVLFEKIYLRTRIEKFSRFILFVLIVVIIATMMVTKNNPFDKNIDWYDKSLDIFWVTIFACYFYCFYSLKILEGCFYYYREVDNKKQYYKHINTDISLVFLQEELNTKNADYITDTVENDAKYKKILAIDFEKTFNVYHLYKYRDNISIEDVRGILLLDIILFVSYLFSRNVYFRIMEANKIDSNILAGAINYIGLLFIVSIIISIFILINRKQRNNKAHTHKSE